MNKIFLIISTILLITNLQAKESELVFDVNSITPVNNTADSKGAFVLELIMSSLVKFACESRSFVDMELDKELLNSTLKMENLAFGIYVTNEYMLSPVVQNSPSEGEYVGFVLQYSF